MLTVCLITLGDPATLTGGYRYHLRLPVLYGYRALRAARADVVLVDSIAAAFLAPWIRLRRPRRLAAIVHQPPGGIDHAPLRRWAQARLDQYLYQRCETVIVASALLADWLDQAIVVPPGRDQKAGTEVNDLRDGARAAALCVANWLPNKGILELLDAAAALPADTLRLHLAGDERTDTAYGQRVTRRIGD